MVFVGTWNQVAILLQTDIGGSITGVHKIHNIALHYFLTTSLTIITLTIIIGNECFLPLLRNVQNSVILILIHLYL